MRSRATRRCFRVFSARLLALWLVAISVPGAAELLEDAVHALVDGHTAHDRDHAGEQPGHCCSGLFQICACHTNAVATLSAATGLSPQLFARSHVPGDERHAARPGFRSAPFRPPTA